jgi:hypothetical protein
MNMKHVFFVVTWQLASSVEAAAAVLGMKVRSVTRQANRMRAAGVKLKQLTDSRFNRHDRSKDVPLNETQRRFMVEHYDFARRVARRKCWVMDIPRGKVEDLVEDAATEGLLRISRRSTKKDFVKETALGLVATAVRRCLFLLLHSQFGRVERKRHLNRATSGPLDYVPDQSSSTPPQEAMRKEEDGPLQSAADKAMSLLGPLPDMSRRKESRETMEYLSLKSKAHQLGLSKHGSVEELRERVASHIRAQMEAEPAPKAESPNEAPGLVPEIVQERLPQARPKSRQQQLAEEFVVAWQRSSKVGEVAKKLGRSVAAVWKYAQSLRELGVNLKKMSNPAIRYARTIQPSIN